MEYRYPLPLRLAEQAALFEEFAMGGAQCHAELSDGSVHQGLLVSNCSAIIDMRGHSSLPFSVESIGRLFQTEEDQAPIERGGWAFFDVWASNSSVQSTASGGG